MIRTACWVAVALLFGGGVRANDVEPRLYSNVPVGANFLSIGYAHSSGEVAFDSSVPVADVEGEIESLVLSYSRGLDVGGRSALLTVALPYADASLEGLYLGQPASGQRQGMGDPKIRFAVNFYGAPALSGDAFRAYQQKTIVGASMSVTVPVGRYVDDRLLNVGTNRWNVVGQVGVSHRMRKWTIEGALGFAWFSDNGEVLETNKLEQDPFGLFRGTVQYHVTPRVWIGAGFLYSFGGDTKLNGVQRDDRQEAWRTGATLSFPLARAHRLQLMATEGVTARVGSDFRTYTASYTWAF